MNTHVYHLQVEHSKNPSPGAPLRGFPTSIPAADAEEAKRTMNAIASALIDGGFAAQVRVAVRTPEGKVFMIKIPDEAV